jgi:hypothetical protein
MTTALRGLPWVETGISGLHNQRLSTFPSHTKKNSRVWWLHFHITPGK